MSDPKAIPLIEKLNALRIVLKINTKKTEIMGFVKQKLENNDLDLKVIRLHLQKDLENFKFFTLFN